MRKIMRKCRIGNFSIECAMVMPIILLCIIALVWLVIFLYDKNVMYRSLVHAVSAADYKNTSTNNQLKNEIEERLYEDLKGELVGVRETNAYVKVSAKKVTAGIECKLNVPMNENVLATLGELKVEITKKRMDAAGIIADVRRVKALYDIADKYIDTDSEISEENMEEK